MKTIKFLLPCACVLLWSGAAFGHPGHDDELAHHGGLMAGLLHPVLGLDPLLAMVAVGLLGAQLGGRALWAVPACFVGAMIVGGTVGMAGVAFPAVETGIALSIVLLGA